MRRSRTLKCIGLAAVNLRIISGRQYFHNETSSQLVKVEAFGLFAEASRAASSMHAYLEGNCVQPQRAFLTLINCMRDAEDCGLRASIPLL